MAANKLQAALKNRSGNNNPGQAANNTNEEGEGYVFGKALREEMERQAEKEPISEIELSRLLDNPYQRLARSVLDDEALEELANSIRSVGFHGALLARPKPGQTGYFELAYGHRRRRAAELAGLTTLPVKVVDLDDTQMLLIMAGENFARVDLDPLHESSVVGQIATTQNLSAKEIGEKIGRKRAWVEQRLALYNAPQDVKDLILQKPNTLGHVQRLITIKEAEVRSALIQQILEKDMTQAELNEWLRQYRAPSIPTPTISTPTPILAANPSPAAPTPTNPTSAATPSAVPTTVFTAGTGPAPSPASAGSPHHPQQPQPQPPAPMPGSAPTPASQRQPPYPPLPPMTAPPSVGPIPGVANPAGFATVDEFRKLEAKAHAAANDTSLGQVTPAEDSDSDDLIEQTFGYGDEFGDGGDPQSDLSDLYAASTNIEDYLPQPASVWGILVAQLAVDAARLENMGQSVEALSMMTTGEWEVLNRTIRQLQSLFAKLG